MIAKATAAANLFLTVPFVLQALGPSQFGVWATLASLVTFAGFLDFGLGNGTMNLVASAHGRGEHARIATIVREGRRALILIALILAAIAAIALPWTPWHRLLGVPETMSSATRVSVAIVLATIVLAVAGRAAAESVCIWTGSMGSGGRHVSSLFPELRMPINSALPMTSPVECEPVPQAAQPC